MSKRLPIDFKHLDGYTGGDRALNEEVLRLFGDHCRAMLAQLENDSEDKGSWGITTHTLKGAARVIGAFDLADAAAAAEKTKPGDAAGILTAIARIKAESAAVHGCIEEFLARKT